MRVRVARVLPLLILTGVAGVVGLYWRFVAGAYTQKTTTAADVQLAGLNLTVTPASIGPSPYVVVTAPDTRSAPVDLTLPAPPPAPPTLTGGSASLGGVVQGPSGPAAGATVRLERHTEAGSATIDVATDSSGHWGVAHVPGGRYRVRAWLTGQATMNDSQVFFLGAAESRQVGLTLQGVDANPRLKFTRKDDSLPLGVSGAVAVSLTTRTVDREGFVVVSGVPGAVVGLVPSPEAGVSATTATSDGSGVARFTVTCHVVGNPTATVTFQGQSATVDLPVCTAPPPVTLPTGGLAAATGGGPNPGGTPVGGTTATTRPGTATTVRPGTATTARSTTPTTRPGGTPRA